jgi:hypothetical protein
MPGPMEVARIPDASFCLTRLTDCERELWDAYFADVVGAPALALSGFVHASMIECGEASPVVFETLKRLDPDNLIGR